MDVSFSFPGVLTGRRGPSNDQASRAALQHSNTAPAAVMEAGRKAEVTNFASVPIDAFPDSVRNLLSKFDKDGDGTVDPAELQEAAKMFEAAQAAADGSIPIVQLPKELQPALGAFDVDGDGTIDPMELGRGAELYQASKDKVKQLTRLALALLLLMGIMLAAITGLTFTVVELSKETSTGSDGIQTVKGTSEPVKIASADSASVNGVTVDRTTGAPAQVAPVLTPTALTSLLPSSVFHEMRYFKVLSPQGAEMQLFVLGTARMPREGSIHGTVIEIVTQVGHVILDDELLYIEHEDASHMFMRAGFPVSNSTSSTGGRALLGIFELMGFFNAIEGLVPENAVDGMTMPKLNDKMLYAEIEVYYPCDSSEYPQIKDSAGNSLATDLCQAKAQDFPGTVMYDANLDGIATRHIAYTEKSWTNGGRTLAQKHFANAPSIVHNELRDVASGLSYVWYERQGDIYKCKITGFATDKAPASLADADPKLAKMMTDLASTKTIPTDKSKFTALGLDGKSVTLPNLHGNSSFTPELEVGTQKVDKSTAVVGTKYKYLGTAAVRGKSARRFMVNTSIAGKWEAWDMYETTDANGYSRPVRFAYADKANAGLQYNEIIEWSYTTVWNATEKLVVPAAFNGLKADEIVDRHECPNRTSPELPVLDGPFGSMWDVNDTTKVTLVSTPEENAADYASGKLTGQTPLAKAFNASLTEGRRKLMERVDAGIYTLEDIEAMDFEHKLAAHLETMQRRFDYALSPEADPDHPDVSSLRRYLHEKEAERRLQSNGRELEQIWANNVAFDVYMWPPCGPEFTPWIDPTPCVEADRKIPKRAKALQIQFVLKFYLQFPYWQGQQVLQANAPNTWPLVFDGFEIGGEVPLDPWKSGIVVAYGAAGWEKANQLFDSMWWTNGWGTLYGKMGVKAGIKDMIPNVVQQMLPASFINMFEQNIVELAISFDSSDPYLMLKGKMCLFLGGFYSCLPLVGFQVFLELKMDVVRMTKDGNLWGMLSDFGLEYYHPTVCQGWFPVYWFAVHWCHHCWGGCPCWGGCCFRTCVPYPCGGYWYVAFWSPYWYPCQTTGSLSAKSWLGFPNVWLPMLMLGDAFKG